ncbi:SAM-dependent DNA methyltransferase [Fibrisoma montanum]|uniref:site-specific DNA-methyltransferase (adenine-specific) n=1 Tax=Fibrisoma montanum TaxID=2305895 RepID=A0A418MFB2_9BACT|nr:class I SAM-dependent DNA methyltransferase [Fibrisoma montanum]RIV25471.1 SAM-dependent DNA methyltransferase [Fibrisoma montanum]
MLTGELRSNIDKVWEAFWTGGISNPLTVIEQITYLLFLRRLDEIQTAKEQQANDLQEPIENPVYPPDQYPLRWSRFKDIDPEARFELFRQSNGVFDFIRNLGQGSSFSRYMRGATFMIQTPRLLDQVVSLLDNVQMNDRDTKGDVYEYLLSKIATSGQNGQFRTPRHIVKMMVAMMAPGTDDVVCDPSAGSAGFLVSTGEYVAEYHRQALYKSAVQQHYRYRLLMGMEFDPTMIRIGAMNLLLHGIEPERLADVDALSKANAGFEDEATVVLANPPFKGSLDVDHVMPDLVRTVATKKTELLFLALIIRGLRTGGRAAVIVPDGVLFGSSKAHQQLRRELVEKHRLQAVISMPSGVFKPYAGVSTAVLVFTKTGSGGTDNVWFYDMRADGYSLDDKRTPTGPSFERFADLEALISQHKETPIHATDIPDIVNRWRNLAGEVDRKRTDQSFLVPVADIRANAYDLSINRYKEVVYEQKEYDTPEVIINRIKALDAERQTDLLALEEMLAQVAEN